MRGRLTDSLEFVVITAGACGDMFTRDAPRVPAAFSLSRYHGLGLCERIGYAKPARFLQRCQQNELMGPQADAEGSSAHVDLQCLQKRCETVGQGLDGNCPGASHR